MWSLAGFSSLQAPASGTQVFDGSWTEAALCSLPCGPLRGQLISPKPAGKSIESASKTEDTVGCNIITEATSRHLCRILCVRSKSRALLTLTGWRLSKGMNTRRQGSLVHLTAFFLPYSSMNVHSNFIQNSPKL